MRIDVDLPIQELESDLARFYQRMQTPGDGLHGLPVIPMALPGLVCRYREVAGEFFLYLEDPARRRLAGCAVFNRTLDVDRRAERYLRSPHTRLGAGYQRRGLATALYTWALEAGLCLISGPRQSVGAHRLWQALSLAHEFHHVHLRDKQLQHLGPDVSAPAFEAFGTRLLLLGAGWSLDRFLAVTGCLPAPADRARRMEVTQGGGPAAAAAWMPLTPERPWQGEPAR